MIFKRFEGNNSPPYCPSNYTPCGGLPVDIDVNLSWDGGDPDPEDTVTYNVYLNYSYPPSLIATVGPYPANQTRIEYDPGTLEICTKYYWKIVAWDNYGASCVGPICSFCTICENYPPDTPSKPSGNTSGYICINHSYVTSTTDPNGLYISYGWDWDGDLSVDEWTDWYESNETCMIVHNWSDPGEYNVSVKAKNTLEKESNWSSPLSVTMLNHPPNAPRKPTPLDGASNVPGDAILCWIGGDPDFCDTVKYDVFFGINYPPFMVVHNQTEECFDPYGSGDLPLFETFYWRVVAWDNHGAFNTSRIWAFKTGINSPPTDPKIDGPEPGNAGVDYNFTFVSTDSDNNTIKYYINWSDGTTTVTGLYASGEVVTLNHTFNEKGEYTIKAIAEDSYGEQSNESTFKIDIPRYKDVNFNINLLSWLLERFPFLEVFLRAMNLLR